MRIYPITKINTGADRSNKFSEINEINKSIRSNLDTKFNNICAICLDSISNESNNILLPCNHIFHISCIMNWIDTQLSKNYTPSCPLCKNKYNFSQFIQRIIQNYIIKIEIIITKLDFLLYNAILLKSQKKYIQSLKSAYSKTKIQIKKAINPKYFSLLKQEIDLPDNIIQLIHETEIIVITDIKKKIENQNNKINLETIGYIKKPLIIFKQLLTSLKF